MIDLTQRLRGGLHSTETIILAGVTHDQRCLEAADEIDRLRYVLGGVCSAIKTGRNEPLQIWLDQINIALEQPK